MRIDPNQGTQTLAETNRGPGQSSSAESGSAVSSVFGQDQAQLSGEPAQIQALAAQAFQLPEVRQERVAALRQVVESGDYHPSAEDVAGAMMASMMVEPAA